MLFADTLLFSKTRPPELFLMLLPTQKNFPHFKVKKISVSFNSSNNSSSNPVNQALRQASLPSPVILRYPELCLGRDPIPEIPACRHSTTPPPKGNIPNQRKRATPHPLSLEILRLQGFHRTELPKVPHHDRQELTRRNLDAVLLRNIRSRHENAARILPGKTPLTHPSPKTNGCVNSANMRESLVILPLP